MIRNTICLFLFSLLSLACVDYGGNHPECEGVACNSPPSDTCVDNLTKRVYKSPGTCNAGACSYGFEDIQCAEGQCADGVCEGCTPSCGIRECGDDGCGGVCGGCDPGCSCNANGQCECGCAYPNYPPDCSLVDYFQCGFDAYCANGSIHVSWHEHVFCDDVEEIIEFTCTYECPYGCDENGYIEWPENGAQLVAEACLGEDACAGILLDNEGAPGLYPFMYFEPQDAAARYQQELAGFLSAYNVSADDYTIEPHPVTWTPDVNKQYNSNAWIAVYDIPLSEDNIDEAARGFFGGHAEFFKTAEAFIQARNSSCSGNTCRANFEQSYCGLKVVSPEADYTGTLTLIASQQDAVLQRAFSTLVPMIPIGKNPWVTQETAASGLIGMTLEFWCADGPHYATITELSEFTFAADPVVFIQTAPTGMSGLEYRLSHKVTVAAEAFLTWTAYVDAFDGTLLKIDPDFICD